MLQKNLRKCPKFSSVWLIGVNFLYFLIGILFIGLSSWGIAQQKEDLVTRALPSGGLVTMVIVGVFLIIIAILGVAGVKFNYKISGRLVLGVYAIALLVIMIMEWSAAGALISFTGRLGEFGPALAVKDYGVYYLINQSYIDCCCGKTACPNDTCWVPARLTYPCDSAEVFRSWLVDYIDERITPIAVIAILIGIVQLLTAVAACSSLKRGRTVEEQKKIAGPLTYDGLYNEGDEAFAGYGYEKYLPNQGGAAGATAPKVAATSPAAPTS